MMLPSLAFLWPFLLIVAAGWFIEWLIDAKLRYWFPYRTLWRTAHASKEWKEEIKPRAVWRDGRCCIWCNTRKRLEGHYRRYIGRLGRACGWRDTSTFCNNCHACFDSGGREGHQADPFLYGVPRIGQMDDAKGPVARPEAVQGVQQQEPAHRAPASSEAGQVEPLGPLPAVAEHLPDLRAVRRKLEAKRGHPLHRQGRLHDVALQEPHERSWRDDL